MTEVVEQQPPPQNGIDLSAAEDEDNNKARPADIEQDMREMERRKRVEAIMGSKLFREELERIVDSARDGGASGILQQLSDIVGMPASRVGSVYKASNCMVPINDIRGVESMGYAKGEKILRCKLAATFRLLDLYGWTQGLGAQITARLKVDQEYFLVNPYGLLYHEVTASSLNKVDMQGQIVEQGTTNFGVNKSHFILHSVLHAARPDIRCAIYIGCSPVVAIASLKAGLLPLTKDACVLGEITTHQYSGALLDAEERDKLVRNLGPNSKVLLLSNYGALCCGETIEEAFFAACHIVQACETQLKLLPVGIDNLVLIPEESRKSIYEQSRRPPEDLERKFAAVVSTGTAGDADVSVAEDKSEPTESATATIKVGAAPKWRVGGAEFEALMRMLDNAGYRTGYIYRHPLVKSDPPKPKNDVELPPAVSSLGYLLEEEELFRQGIWKKGEFRKGGDRSRWLNSPNVYQKVEVLETGTPDPKKITKWVAEGSPTHSTPVRIEDPLQFVPAGTNPKEFKRLQQQIKDNRRADKISAGPQSHILEGVTWDEANRIKDATVSSAGDHVVLMGAASKGIIQRGFQHNATVYKAPYAKNPFDSVTDDELNEYKRTVERKKKSIHGEYTDTDFSESEALSSLPTSGAQIIHQTKTAGVSQSEPEDVLEHQVIRIETQQAPVPSQPEVVLSDATLSFINGERSHTATNRKPPTGRDTGDLINCSNEKAQDISDDDNEADDNGDGVDGDPANDLHLLSSHVSQANKENFFAGEQNVRRNALLIAELKKDLWFQRQRNRFKTSSESHSSSPTPDDELDAANNSQADEIGGSFSIKKINVEHKIIENSTNNPAAIESIMPISAANPCRFNVSSATDTSAQSWESFATYSEAYSQRQRELQQFQRERENMAHQGVKHLEPVYNSATEPEYVDMSACVCPEYNYAQQEPQSLNNNNIMNMNKNYPQHDNHPVHHVYKKSIFCNTPAVCESVFDAMQRPVDNDLIFNIPFMVHSPYSTCPTSPRKARSDTPPRSSAMTSPSRLKQPQHSASGSYGIAAAPLPLPLPYRTVSHFGFKSPLCEPQPEHKHIPCVETVKYSYAPLRKSASYEEIFSSPRFVDLCENCFEKMLRFKPELGQMRARLRNLSEFHAVPSRLGGGTSSITEVVDGDANNADNEAGLLSTEGAALANYEYIDVLCPTEMTETLPLFSSQLEPVLEVEEHEGSSSLGEQEALPNSGATAAVSSTFLDKIMRLNYSEESANGTFTQTPHTVSSSISVDLDERDLEERDLEERDLEERDLSLSVAEKNEEIVAVPSETDHCVDEMNLLNAVSWELVEVSRDCRETRSPQCQDIEITQKIAIDAQQQVASVTEIWEFGNWRERVDQLDNANVPTADNSLERGNASNAEIATPSKDVARANNTGSSFSEPGYKRSGFMSRSQRSERKQEFHDIWEDHVHYYKTKERLQHNPSDTEEEVGSSDQVEVFSSRSYFVKQPQFDHEVDYGAIKDGAGMEGQAVEIGPNTSLPSEVVAVEPEEANSDSGESAATFSVCASRENLFFRSCGSESPFADRALPRVDDNVIELGGGALNPHNAALSPVESQEENETSSMLSEAMEHIHLTTATNVNPETRPHNCAIQADLIDDDDVSSERLIKVQNLFERPPVVAEVDTDASVQMDNPNKENTSIDDDESNSPFNAIERKILEKISSNQLKRNDEIFEKIEMTIRNKITPSKIDQMLLQCAETASNANPPPTNDFIVDGRPFNKTMSDLLRKTRNDNDSNTSSDDERYNSWNTLKAVPSQTTIHGAFRRQSRSLTPCKPSSSSVESSGSGPFLSSVQKKNILKTSTPNKLTLRRLPAAPQSSCSTPEFGGTHSRQPKRNFVLENIRNASKTRPVNVKRLQPARGAAASGSSDKLSRASSNNSLLVEGTTDSQAELTVHSEEFTGVFTFQSNLVRGSPRFWVSLGQQTPVRRPHESRITFTRRRKQPAPQKLPSLNGCKSSSSMALLRNEVATGPVNAAASPMDDEMLAALDAIPSTSRHNYSCGANSPATGPTRVDVALEQLGDEINKISPKLASSKRKMDNYDNEVSKMMRQMDECIVEQSEINAQHQELREQISINQYVDEIEQQVQTYSISETED